MTQEEYNSVIEKLTASVSIDDRQKDPYFAVPNCADLSEVQRKTLDQASMCAPVETTDTLLSVEGESSNNDNSTSILFSHLQSLDSVRDAYLSKLTGPVEASSLPEEVAQIERMSLDEFRAFFELLSLDYVKNCSLSKKPKDAF